MFKVLEGRAYRLQHPWVGIVNRSQADINKNVDMIVARRKEREYFETSPEYGHLSSKMGSEYLAKLLSKVLFIHVALMLFSLIYGLHYKYIELSYLSNIEKLSFFPSSFFIFFFLSASRDCYQAANTKYHCFNK